MAAYKRFYKEVPRTGAGVPADWRGTVWECQILTEFEEEGRVTKGPCAAKLKCTDHATNPLRNHMGLGLEI